MPMVARRGAAIVEGNRRRDVVNVPRFTHAEARALHWLGMLVAVRNAAFDAGMDFRLIEVPDRVAKLLQLTGLTGVFVDPERC